MKLIAAIVMVMMAGPVAAQSGANCAPRETVIGRLASRYSETRQSIGLGANGSVIEVYASDESGTWTITVTLTSGLTCVVASGYAFERTSDPLPTPGDPT